MDESEEMSRRSERAQQAYSGAYYADAAQISFQYPEEKHVSLLDVLLVLTRHRRMIRMVTGIGLVVGIIVAMLPEEPQYFASATVIREANGSAEANAYSPLTRFGLGAGVATGGLTSQTYPDVLLSREVRLAVVRDTFYISRLDSTAQLFDYLNKPAGWWTKTASRMNAYTIGLPGTIRRALQGDDDAAKRARSKSVEASGNSGSETRTEVEFPSAREERAMATVMKLVLTSIDRETGLMHVTATTDDPRLSADLVQSFIRHLEVRVRDFYSAKAEQDLAFVQDRFDAADEDLQRAEENLASFMDRNTGIQSARLQAEAERLGRQVKFKEQLYGSLQAQLTQAELDLQHSKPVVTVLEGAVPPRKPQASHPGLVILLSLFVGGLVGVGLALAKGFIEHLEGEDGEKEKLGQIRSSYQNSRLYRRVLSLKRNGSKV